MGKETGIAWTDATLNDWWGCVEVSPGCNFCYAKTLALRWGREVWGVHAPRYFTKKGFDQALAWQRATEKEGVRKRVFVQSMSDIFEKLPQDHPQREEMDRHRMRFFREIIPACPNLDFQLLTKRIGNVRDLVPHEWLDPAYWPANAWLGISIVNQAEADRDIRKALALPAGLVFLSVEPMLGAVDLTKGSALCINAAACPSEPSGFCYDPFSDLEKTVGWVIIGGESGTQARSMDLGWAISLVEQCKAAKVPVFMKQLGRRPLGCDPDGSAPWPVSDSHGSKIEEFPEPLQVREFPAVIS